VPEPSRKPSFSLVELVIVVVIIGVIAAIAVPRISRGAVGASEAALRGSLKTLRNAIDFYAAEHGGEWPATDKSQTTFIEQMTKTTDAAGAVGTTAGVHIYGPYLRRIPAIPVGPNVGATGIKFKEDGHVFEGESQYGWVYNFKTGHIYTNTDDLDEKGIGYNTY
jgi:prepilin-type N-terminal cleavage/methylation domain-containing protein